MTPPPRSIEVIARAIIRQDSRILVCRNCKHGYMYLPGGHIEFGEPAAAALARELVEELEPTEGGAPAPTASDFRVGDCELVCEVLFGAEADRHHELNMVFHVELPAVLRGGLRSRETAIAFEWVDQASLVELDLRPDVIRAWLVTGGRERRGPGVQWVGAGPKA